MLISVSHLFYTTHMNAFIIAYLMCTESITNTSTSFSRTALFQISTCSDSDKVI